MSEINKQVGAHIRVFRKKRGLTLDELAEIIHKSKSTISKYEKGEITVDIETLYEIADAVQVHAEQLLYRRPEHTSIAGSGANPAFFSGVSQFYSYLFDGRSNRIMRCVFDVLSETEELFGLSIMQKNEFYNKKFSTKYISTTKTPPPADFLCRSRDFYVSIVMRICQIHG